MEEIVTKDIAGGTKTMEGMRSSVVAILADTVQRQEIDLGSSEVMASSKQYIKLQNAAARASEIATIQNMKARVANYRIPPYVL